MDEGVDEGENCSGERGVSCWMDTVGLLVVGVVVDVLIIFVVDCGR